MFSNQASRTGSHLLLLVLLAAPAAAAGVIFNGVDVWNTPDDGSSWTDLSAEPIPADFFCSGSAPFSGRIYWQGEALATSPPEALGNVDTIIHRLDDAVFDHKGVASTRVKVAALSLVGIKPIKTGCGLFDVRVSLAPVEQPTTVMKIVREGKGGGSFEVPLELIARLRFIPVDGKRGEVLELDHPVSFVPGDFRWTSKPNKPGGDKLRGFVLVDTDGDGSADTFLPGTSNFYPVGYKAESAGKLALPCKIGCHSDSGECHCVTAEF